ncbi:plasmid transfer protein TraB [Streptomyces sp. BE308]|uniref:plasmid transfer protein TraB n=1 Tax=Streptomyces sp. BE308 TaxID=3002529 RepID=UPI002E7A23B4|nr:plasmid transfer protein TraB [Streptomyces sp. BE308]MEE1791422.1 plasmid transfer protein TraB [Streptomyces sp. BE308]
MTDHDSERQHEEHLKGGSSASGIGAYLLHRAKPHLPPWICVGGLGLAGGGANLMWAGSAGGAVGLTLASVALTGATWWAGKSTGQQRRLHSAITVAAGSAWLTGAALAGPLTGVMPHAFAMGGPVMALSWNIRMVMRRSPDSTGQSSDKGLLEKVGLARTRIGTPKVEANKVTLPYALPAGEATNDDMAKALPRIASALDVPTTAVRMRPDPDSARRGTVTIVPVDMLKTVTWWPGPSNPGGSIAEPLVIGIYDDGRQLELTLPQAIHLLIMGATGAGKTEGAMDVLAEVLTRRDVAVWLSDPKRGQDLGEAFPACDWVVDTPDGSGILIEAVKAAIPARQKWLGDHSYRSWCPEAAEVQNSTDHTCRPDRTACGCPGIAYLLAWFEEAANTLRAVDDDAFTGIAQEARSAGISLIVSMQRASGYQISTDTRASLPAAMCFGVDERDAGFALPTEVLEAGANPGAWGNKRPGYCYLVSAGVDEDLWSTPSRTYRNDPVALDWVARHFAPFRMGIDPVTAAAAAGVAGQLYTGRDRPGQQAEAQDAPEDDDVTTSLVDPEDAGIDPEKDLPEPDDGDDFALVPPDTRPELGTDEAREVIERLLEQWECEGRMVVGPKDFLAHSQEIGRKPTWIKNQVRDMRAAGRLVETSETGRYRIAPALTPA